MLFIKKKSQNIYISRKKKVNLLIIEDGEKMHYTAIKNILRLLSKLNRKTKHAYHYYINCLNGFQKGSARGKHYEYCGSNGHVKVKMPTEKGKWLRFHDRQYQFKIPFMLHSDCIKTSR